MDERERLSFERPSMSKELEEKLKQFKLNSNSFMRYAQSNFLDDLARSIYKSITRAIEKYGGVPIRDKVKQQSYRLACSAVREVDMIQVIAEDLAQSASYFVPFVSEALCSATTAEERKQLIALVVSDLRDVAMASFFKTILMYSPIGEDEYENVRAAFEEYFGIEYTEFGYHFNKDSIAKAYRDSDSLNN